VFFELKYLFINKKSFGDTKSTLSVVLLKTVAITLPIASEKDYIWKI
jgi:hypothetical protein